MSTFSSPQVGSALAALRVLADTIRDLGSVPNGHLYAHVMGSLSIDSYTRAIQLLKDAELVRERAHVLEWIGPPKPECKAP